MIILITGGSSGLGEAITRRHAKEAGNKVYFTYNQSAENAKAIEQEFSNASAIKCDFTNEAEVTELAEKIASLNIDVLINNAYNCYFLNSYFHKTDVADFVTAFHNNLVPTIQLTKSAITAFRKKKSGKIITVLTAALINTPPVGASVYTANKAYLEALSKIWSVENSKYNITSNTVSPAFMLTGFTKDMDERMVEQIASNNPTQKLLTTQEVADSIFFLSSASQHINGINLVLNSGLNIK